MRAEYVGLAYHYRKAFESGLSGGDPGDPSCLERKPWAGWRTKWPELPGRLENWKLTSDKQQFS